MRSTYFRLNHLRLTLSYSNEFPSMLYRRNKSVLTSMRPVPENAHRIVLMRHGESAFNNANIFTGWCDVALTQRGIVEAVESGEVFRSHHILFRRCYVSLLTRSIVTAQRSLEAAGTSFVPMKFDWRLNERHYGALQGLSKDRIAERLGTARVMVWRRSYAGKPPIMTSHHPHYDIIQEDIRYRHVKEQIPCTESLQDCQIRVVQAWDDIVRELLTEAHRAPDDEKRLTLSASPSYLNSSPYSLIVAHANSLRALIMYLDNIPEDDIEGLNIPTAIPFYYDIDLTTGKVISHPGDTTTGTHDHHENVGNRKSNVSNLKSSHVNERFRGVYITDERKKRSFLERRRAANDPWLWALHDDQVARSMLVDDDDDHNSPHAINNGDGSLLSDDGMNQEAARNTELFGSHHSLNTPT